MMLKMIVMLQGDSLIDQINAGTTQKTEHRVTTMDNVWQLFGLIVILVIILIAAYYTSRFVGGAKINQLKNSNFKVIDTYRITQNKALQIVKVANKYLVISISKDSIRFITELEETDVLSKEVPSEEKQNFKLILEKLKGNKE